MQNILLILPVSIAGTHIINGFAKGLSENSYNVLAIDVRKLENLKDQQAIHEFSPDAVICYDYGYFLYEFATKFIDSFVCSKIHYFADVPNSSWALGQNKKIYSDFQKYINVNKEIKLLFWDKKYLKSFKNVYTKFFPICIDCDIYNTDFKDYKYDITFVGRPKTIVRQEILAEVIKNFPDRLKIFSYPEHFSSSISEMSQLLNEKELKIYKNSYCGYIYDQSKMSQIYCCSKINLNINLQGENSLNYRTYEVLASGGFLLNDKREDIKSLGLFNCLDVYSDKKELIEKIQHYINHPADGKIRAALGREKIHTMYNVKARARGLLCQDE